MNKNKPTIQRRDFLRWGALATTGAAIAACDGNSAPAAADANGNTQPPTFDAAQSCQPTRNDALGPFFEAGAPMRMQIASNSEPGERLSVSVDVVSDDCKTPIDGVLVDIWQADRDGNYHDAGTEYRLRGQVMTDASGQFSIDTIRPGNYQIAEGMWRPAHLHFMFTKPGFESFATQLYFAGDRYLAPNDGCGSCGSDDSKRIIALVPTKDPNRMLGQWRVVLGRAA